MPHRLLLVLTLLAAGCAPAITSVSPASGLPGTLVEIQGRGFDPVPHNNTVRIGGGETRIISGDKTHLRVVALRSIATGTVEVQTPTLTMTSTDEFKREGSTLRATPLVDSSAELVVGQGDYTTDKRYDMLALGTNQKILVVLTKPSDIDPETVDGKPMGVTAKQWVTDRLAQTNTYFQQASYNATSVAFTTTPDWVALGQTRDFYCWQQEDIDRAQAQLDALNLDPSATQEQLDTAKEKVDNAKNAGNLLQEPDFLLAEALLGAKAAVADFDSYTDYFLVVAGPFLRGQNFGTSTGYHAESTNPALPLKFDIDLNGPKGITYVAEGADWGRMVHELSHFFASGDIYGESFADGSSVEGNAAPFSMMGSHDEHPLYIGYDLTQKLHYLNETASGNVAALEWGSTPDRDESIDLVAHATTQDPTGDATKHVLRLKVTDGLYYFVEPRQQADPAADYVFDPSIPLDPSNPAWKGGVIIYKAVENNNQSNNNERPISLLPPARMLQVGDSFEDPARTIRIDVTQKLADRPAKYRVRVRWGHLPSADPNGQYDLRITPWDPPPWETPDLWANSTKNDETSPAKVIYKNHEPGDETKAIGNGDPPWVGHDNTLFARVTNQGMQETPENVKVTFYVNTPPGIGDNGNWTPFDTVDIGQLAAGESREVQATRKWRPAVGEHTCVKVELHKQNGEVTFDNNSAQENFNEFETGSASPYRVIEFDFIARNPYTAPGVMDLQARQVPLDWFVALEHGTVWLRPKEEKKVHAVIWTDRLSEWEGGQDRKRGPRKPQIQLEGWMDRFSDRVFAVGGITEFIQAVRDVRVNIEVRSEKKVGNPFSVFGSVSPQVGVVPIAVHVTDPDGVVHVERTKTNNASGISHTTTYKATRAGTYRIQAYTLGGSLAGEAESSVITQGVN